MEDRCQYCGSLKVNCEGTCLAHTVIREFEDNERAIREAEIARRDRMMNDDIRMAKMNMADKLSLDRDMARNLASQGYDPTRRSVYFVIDGLHFQVIRPEGSVLVRHGNGAPYKWSTVESRLDLGNILISTA